MAESSSVKNLLAAELKMERAKDPKFSTPDKDAGKLTNVPEVSNVDP
jgi:hypothetical protein